MKKILLLMILSLTFLSCGKEESSGKRKLKLAHGLNETHPVHKGMEKFAELLKEKTNGELEVEIYPNGQLGQERELIELMQAGAIDMTKASASPIEGFVKEYAVLSMPYLFRSYDHFLKTLESSVGEEFLMLPEKSGFIGIGYFTAGTRNFYGSRPINKPEDLKGMKVRVQPSNTAIKMVESLGGTATPLAYGELYTALQQKVVDGAENNISAITNDRHGEVSKFYSYDEHTIVPDVFLISNATWKKLTEDQKKKVKEAALEAFRYQVQLWDEMETKQEEVAKNMGVQFVYPEKGPFQEKVKPMYDEMSKNLKMKELIEEIQKVQ